MEPRYLMTDDELLNRLFQVAAHGLTHQHYKHVCDKATLYGQLVAGVDLSKLLKQYVRRENKELFEQRVNLTQHIVTAVCKNLLDVFYKIPRSNSARRVIAYASESNDTADKKVEEIEKLLSGFWGPFSWDDYLGSRFIELNSVDPNSFVVFEWDAFDGKKEMIKPRPYEVSSSNAVDFEYKNKNLLYLIVKDDHWYDNPNVGGTTIENKIKKPHEDQTQGIKYTLYGPDKTWQILQISDQAAPMNPIEEGVPYVTTIGGNQTQAVKIGKNFYEFKEFLPHKLGRVPAFRVGYLRDLATDGETFVNPLHACEPYLLKTIKVNSEFDLVATLLAFPQQIKYGMKCEDEKCYKGYYDNGIECATCHGSGVRSTAPSAQDSISIPMPGSKEEMIPLEEFIKYIHPPVDIVKWQEEYIDKLSEKAKSIMFNSDIFSKKEVADTATGKNLDMSNVYDTLWPFSQCYARTWVFGTTTMAKLADRDKNLVAVYTFGKDFKLKTLDSLIADLAVANTLNNSALQQHLNNDIAEIIFSEKPIDLMRYKLQQVYNPFSGKNDKDIMLLMSGNFVSRKEKVLHANYGKIFDELELEFAEQKKNFYTENRTVQRKAIYDKVDEIIALIDAETPEPQIPIA